MADNRHAEAVDILAHYTAALALRHERVVTLYHVRMLPGPISKAVRARVMEIADGLAPAAEEYEAAYDAVIHGTGAAS